MLTRRTPPAAALLVAALAAVSGPASAADDGIVRVRSAYPLAETVERLKADIAGKGILFFSEIDQAGLAAAAGIEILPSTLLVFGNPPLGTLFISSDPDAGLDWPVRLLVHENADGAVWAAYTDFAWIAARHGITDRAAEFETASGVVASITASVQ
jgi:uncharacterized protein (DUF302 family)